MPRPLNKIAAEILTDLGPPGSSLPPSLVHALPYLDAMLSLNSIHDRYGLDTAEDIVLRFLTNASMWRGPVARRIKEELNQLLRSTKNA